MAVKYLRWVAVFIPIIFLIDVALFLIADPYQIYHKSWLNNDYFMANTRKSAPGIIRNAEFDSIIIAASMGQNLSPLEASSALKGDFVNLSMLGSRVVEKSIVLDYALKNKVIKNVIISMDSIGKYDEGPLDMPLNSVLFLYNDSRVDDIKLYLGFNAVGFLFCGNTFFKGQCPGSKPLPYLTKRPEFFEKRFGVSGDGFKNPGKERASALKGILEVIAANSKQISFDEIKVAENLRKDKAVFNDSMLKRIDSHQETRFYFFSPPCSRVYHALLRQHDPTGFMIYKNRITLVADAFEKRQNAKVFGFGDFPFVDDLANYMDYCHYHRKIDTVILESMADGKGELFPDKLPQYFSHIEKRALSLDLVALTDEIKSNVL